MFKTFHRIVMVMFGVFMAVELVNMFQAERFSNQSIYHRIGFFGYMILVWLLIGQLNNSSDKK